MSSMTPNVLVEGTTFRRWCQQGDVARVEALLMAGTVPVDTAQPDGCTGLWLAAESGHADVVRLLAASGADLHARKQPGGVPALYVAAQNGHRDVVEMLIHCGADVDMTKDTGSTPLFIAAQQNHEDIVRLLLAAGASVRIHTEQSFTPLMIAAYQGNAGCVSALLQAGADPNETVKGRTAVQWAEANGHGARIATVLQRAQALEAPLQLPMPSGGLDDGACPSAPNRYPAPQPNMVDMSRRSPNQRSRSLGAKERVARRVGSHGPRPSRNEPYGGAVALRGADRPSVTVPLQVAARPSGGGGRSSVGRQRRSMGRDSPRGRGVASNSSALLAPSAASLLGRGEELRPNRAMARSDLRTLMDREVQANARTRAEIARELSRAGEPTASLVPLTPEQVHGVQQEWGVFCKVVASRAAQLYETLDERFAADWLVHDVSAVRDYATRAREAARHWCLAEGGAGGRRFGVRSASAARGMRSEPPVIPAGALEDLEAFLSAGAGAKGPATLSAELAR